MPGLLVANLQRRPGRTLLTAAGTAVGVATIVAMLAVTAGVQQSAGKLVHLGNADFAIFQSGTSDPTTSVLPTSLVRRVRQTPGVARATPLLLLVDAIPKQAGAIIFGVDPGGFIAKRLVMVRGHPPSGPGQVAVGDGLESQIQGGIGSTLKIKGRPFRIVGVYHAGISLQDTGAAITLPAGQALIGRQSEATAIAVQLQSGARTKPVEARLRREITGIETISTTEEAARAGANGQLIDNAVLVIVVLALIIGGIAVANTMLLSVLERRSEFALLSAVGWSGRQIAGLVLAEGVSLSLLGAAGGLALGVAGSVLLIRALGVSTFVSAQVTAWGLGRGLIVGVAIGVLGGLYPAWRVTRLPPASALARR